METVKRKIALDLDDTLADALSIVVARINNDLGLSLSKGDFKDWKMVNLQKEYGISWEYTHEIYHKVWVENWKSIPALASPDLLGKALKHYDIDIVTGRSEGSIDYCRRWLEENYAGIGFRNIVRVNEVHKKVELDYDIFMDDAPTLADALIEANYRGKHLMLVDQVYNRRIVDDGINIVRVRNVNAALFLALKETDAAKNRDKSRS